MKKIMSESDVYFLQVIGSKIIINDNYDGIMILDRNMNFLKKIKIFEGICIYNSFVTGKNEFVLFCPDENKMVYINIENEKVYLMDVPESVKNEIISEIILNDTSKSIFKTNKSKYVALDKKNKKLEIIQYDNSFVELEKKQIWDGNVDILKKYSDCNNRDVKGHSFVAIYEEKIIIYNNQQLREVFPKRGYIFNNAKIMNNCSDMYLVTLSNKKTDNYKSVLSIIDMK